MRLTDPLLEVSRDGGDLGTPAAAVFVSVTVRTQRHLTVHTEHRAHLQRVVQPAAPR